MNEAAASVVAYWTAGGWMSLPIAVASLGIWYYFLRCRRRLQAAWAWDGATPEQAAWEETVKRIEESLGRDVIVLAAWTAVAPLLGLAGTVGGMIRTFVAVAQAGGDTGPRVAGGISQALITTQAGLVVAIPGLFGVARVERMRARFRARMNLVRTVRRREGDGA